MVAKHQVHKFARVLLVLVLLEVKCQIHASPCNVGAGGRQLVCVVKTPSESSSGANHLAGRCGVRVLHFDASDVAQVADDFYTGHDLTELLFTSCSMVEMPYSLINPSCGTLKTLSLRSCTIGSKTLQDDGLLRCTLLEDLVISGGISAISPKAFRGLERLQRLDLAGNNIQSLEPNTFQGLSNLHRLDLQDNQIKRLEASAFEPVNRTLKQVELKGNPFHCDCSLQWLKVWINSHQSTEKNSCMPFYSHKITCSTPTSGDLTTLAFCTNRTTPPKPDKSCTNLQQMLKAMHNFLQNCPSTPNDQIEYCATLQALQTLTVTSDKNLCKKEVEQIAMTSPKKCSTYPDDKCASKTNVLTASNHTSETKKPCQCLLNKLAALVNFNKKCNSLIVNAHRKKVCAILRHMQAPPKMSASTPTDQEKKCDCNLEKQLAKSILKRSCHNHGENQCANIASIPTKSPPNTNADSQYRCNLEKTLARVILGVNCLSPRDDTSLQYCQSTTTPLQSLMVPVKAGKVECPRDNMLTSDFCAGMARLQDTASNC